MQTQPIKARGATKTVMGISNLDVHYLVREAKPLEGEFLQKAFGQDGTFRLKFRHADFVLHLPDSAFLTQRPPQFTAHPESFVMLLRKRLTGRLEKITHVGFDRIIQLHFADVSVVAELFGDGNLLLLDGVDYILKPWRSEEFATRKLYSGQKYRAPPQEKVHPAQFDPAVLNPLAGPLVTALAKTVNLSPFYLEEACARAGLDKKIPANRITAVQKQKIKDAVSGLLDETPAPRIYLKDGKPAHAAPFALHALQGLESQATATFSEALEAVFQSEHAARAQVEVEDAEAKPDERKAAVLEKQRFSLESFRQRAADAQAKAEWIYLNYALIEALREHSDSEEETIRNLHLIPDELKFRKKRHRIEIEVPENAETANA